MRQRRREEERERFGCGLVGVGVKGYRNPGPHLEKSCEEKIEAKDKVEKVARKGEWKGVYITVEEKEYLVNGASFPAYFVVKQNLIESQLILDIQTAGGKKTANRLSSKKYDCIVHGALVKQQKI